MTELGSQMNCGKTVLLNDEQCQTHCGFIILLIIVLFISFHLPTGHNANKHLKKIRILDSQADYRGTRKYFNSTDRMKSWKEM